MSLKGDEGADPGEQLPTIEPFDLARIVDLSEQRIRQRSLQRKIRTAGTLAVGIAIGALALYSLGTSRGPGVDHSLAASAQFVNLMGNDREIRIAVTGAKGRFGIALGFRKDSPIVEQDPGIGKRTRFGGPDQPASFVLPAAATPLFLVVTDTPADEVVRRFFLDRTQAGGPFDDPAKTMEKLKEHLMGLGYTTLDILQVKSP